LTCDLMQWTQGSQRLKKMSPSFATALIYLHHHQFRLYYYYYILLLKSCIWLYAYDIWTLSIFNISLVWLNIYGLWYDDVVCIIMWFMSCFMNGLESFMFVLQSMFCVCFKLCMFYALWPFWCCQRGREKWVF